MPPSFYYLDKTIARLELCVTPPAVFRKPAAPLSVLGNGVDQSAAALLDLGDSAKQRGSYVLRLVDRAFAVAAHGSCERAEIRLRSEQVHADVGFGFVGAADLRHA